MKGVGNFFRWIWQDRRRAIGALIILGLLYFGYTKYFKKTTAATQTQTAQVTKGTIVSSVSASGSILTSNVLPITSSAAGVVSQVLVKDGDHVTKGQKIAKIELDPAGAQNNASDYASYLSAKNNLDSAKTNQYSLQSAMFSANSK